MERFAGTVEELCDVDVAGLLDTLPPFAEWPQASDRPSMLIASHHAFPVIAEVHRAHYLGTRARDFLYSVVLPGNEIEPHIDHMGPDWLCRIHIPIITNPGAVMEIEGELHHMTVGKAWKVNPLRRHSVRNTGRTPRIHLMFDVCALLAQ